MTSKFKRGDRVQQIVRPIVGDVTSFQVDQETGDRLVLVESVGADGEPHSKYFKEDELEAVPAPAPTATPAPTAKTKVQP
jgi:hypothetical protein